MGAAWLETAGSIAFKDLVGLLLVGLLREQPANALRFVRGGSYSYTGTNESRPASVAVRLHLLNPGAEP